VAWAAQRSPDQVNSSAMQNTSFSSIPTENLCDKNKNDLLSRFQKGRMNFKVTKGSHHNRKWWGARRSKPQARRTLGSASELESEPSIPFVACRDAASTRRGAGGCPRNTLGVNSGSRCTTIKSNMLYRLSSMPNCAFASSSEKPPCRLALQLQLLSMPTSTNMALNIHSWCQKDDG
jgi:hypothetical protein